MSGFLLGVVGGQSALCFLELGQNVAPNNSIAPCANDYIISNYCYLGYVPPRQPRERNKRNPPVGGDRLIRTAVLKTTTPQEDWGP